MTSSPSFWRQRLAELLAALHSFSVKQQLWLAALALVFVGSLLGLLSYLNGLILVPVPAQGGSLTEGIIGTPRFINPLLATSDADRDLTALIYSGLLRVTKDGNLEPDLAESYEVSADARTYTFRLRPGLTFHDGRPLTTDDIVFTIERAQDPLLKSASRAAWEGVAVEKVNEREIRFLLRQPYGAFLENLTLGILPKHIWGTITPDAFSLARENLEPTGSGPFKMAGSKFDRSGLPLWYQLEAFANFALGGPKLDELQLNFYPNEDELKTAFQKGAVEGLSAIRPELSAQLLTRHSQVMTAPLPRAFAVFFNQNQTEIFTLHEVRRALDAALNKEELIEKVLLGFGTPLNSPLPPGALGYRDEEDGLAANQLAKAKAILTTAGWQQDASGHWSKKVKAKTYQLRFTLSAPNSLELKLVAEELARQWRELGAEVELKLFDLSDLNQNIIRPRKYEALFFGEILGRDPDPYAFWHSSQRLDPGLNVAMYANIKVDKILSEARSLENRAARDEKLGEFAALVSADHPASFIYAPAFIYLLPARLNGVDLPPLVTAAERFSRVHEWHEGTDYVWPIFAR